MAVLIDRPRWPAHGTHFGHLVSDTSLVELHRFAHVQQLPLRAFDHDHYDVPAGRYEQLVEAGAVAVGESELLRRLVASGLRVRPRERTPSRRSVLPGLRAAWHDLLPAAPELGNDLLRRWSEPHRHYHDVRHLAGLLTAVAQLEERPSRPLLLAGWFHDAVLTRAPGDDERRSADLACSELSAVGVPSAEVAEVARLVLVTIEHQPDPHDQDGCRLSDADLSVLGQPQGRYFVYARDLRREYEHLADSQFGRGRIAALDAILSIEPLFRTGTGQRRWLAQARRNLTQERDLWEGWVGEPERGTGAATSVFGG